MEYDKTELDKKIDYYNFMINFYKSMHKLDIVIEYQMKISELQNKN